MLLTEKRAGPPKGGVEGAQFLSQTGERGLLRGKIAGRRVGGRIPGGQSRIRRGRVSHGLALFEGVRRRRWLAEWRG